MSLVHRLRSRIYDAAIVPMTASWYAAVLERIEAGSHLLDIGIGTGAALLANRAHVESRNIRVTGIDIDAAYVETCQAAIRGHGLADRIDARLESVYDHRGGPYDAAYFSGSFMLLPDPEGALRHVSSLLAGGAPIFFTQTFEHGRSRVVERIKPALRFVTSIDFGGVTYEDHFRGALARGGLEIDERTVVHAGRARSSVLVKARRAA